MASVSEALPGRGSPMAAAVRRLRQRRVWMRVMAVGSAMVAVAVVAVARHRHDESSAFASGPAASSAKSGRLVTSAVGESVVPRDVRRRAAYDKSKLEQEASFAGDVFKGIKDFFNPPAPPPSEADIAAQERRQEAVLEAEKTLRSLRLNVIAGTDDEGAPQRRAAPIGVLQSKGKQAVAIFAATDEEILRDLLLSLRISAKEFADRNVLIVPALVSRKTRSLVDFSQQLSGAKLMNQGQVALPAPVDDEDRKTWGELLASEFDEADSQGALEQALTGGLALLLQRSGKIARRGVGRPQWEAVFADLDI